MGAMESLNHTQQTIRKTTKYKDLSRLLSILRVLNQN